MTSFDRRKFLRQLAAGGALFGARDVVFSSKALAECCLGNSNISILGGLLRQQPVGALPRLTAARVVVGAHKYGLSVGKGGVVFTALTAGAPPIAALALPTSSPEDAPDWTVSGAAVLVPAITFAPVPGSAAAPITVVPTIPGPVPVEAIETDSGLAVFVLRDPDTKDHGAKRFATFQRTDRSEFKLRTLVVPRPAANVRQVGK